MPRRSTRTKTTTVQVDRNTLRDGYLRFRASERFVTTGGGTITHVVLRVDGVDYPGSSQSPYHAEMDALEAALKAKGGRLEELVKSADKTVHCTAKPCCYRCSVVLGLLGFRARDANTTKAPSGMGSTEWTLPSTLKACLAVEYGDIQALLPGFSNVNRL